MRHLSIVHLYLSIFVFCVPHIGAGTYAVVGIVTRGLMDPFPPQIFTEINVQLLNTAVL